MSLDDDDSGNDADMQSESDAEPQRGSDPTTPQNSDGSVPAPVTSGKISNGGQRKHEDYDDKADVKSTHKLMSTNHRLSAANGLQ